MDTVYGLRALCTKPRHPVVAIGNFDGVHRGHLRIFETAQSLAPKVGGQAVVLTFEPHPARLLAPSFAPRLITTLARKLELIAGAGVALTIVEPFDASLAARSAESFVNDLLVGGLGISAVCVGQDFTFGKGRAGTVATLSALAAQHHFDVAVVPPVSVKDIVCSSTKVREFVLEGQLAGAALLLGRDHEIEGLVGHGAARGRGLGFATANLEPETEGFLPAPGVYAGWAEVAGQPQRWPAAINIGTNPTFGDGAPMTIEAHLLDFDGNLYGRRLRLGFRRRLRAEVRFATAEALAAQIRRDVDETRASFGATPAPERDP